MGASDHPFRAAIGDALERAVSALGDKSVELIKTGFPDSNVRIPLYFVNEEGNAASYCNVDFLVLKDDKVRIVLEIEEGAIDPVRICGNYMTSAFSQFHIHKDGGRRAEMSSNVIFIQIINTAELTAEEMDRTNQLEDMEKAIRDKPVKDSSVTGYRLFYGTSDDFRTDKTGLVQTVIKALTNSEKEQSKPA